MKFSYCSKLNNIDIIFAFVFCKTNQFIAFVFYIFEFLKEKKCEKGIRISNEIFSSFGEIDVYPIYAVENVLN